MGKDEYSSLSIISDAGHQVPEALFQSVIKAYPTCFGAATTKKEGGLEINVLSSPADMDKLKKINKGFENRILLFHFGNFPEGYLAESNQPYRLLVGPDGKKAILACTLVGDFNKWSGDGTKHSATFWCANGHLLPKMQNLYRLCGEDINKFKIELTSAVMKKEIADLIGPQGGLITLILSVDDKAEVTQYMRSWPTFKKFDWGSTSHVLDYIQEAPAKVVAPAKGKFASALVEDDDDEEEINIPLKKTKKVEKQGPIINKETPKEVPKDVDLTDKLPKEKEWAARDGGILRRVTFEDGRIMILWYPPLHVTKRKNLRKMYKQVCARQVTNQELDARKGVVPTPDYLADQQIKDFGELGKRIDETATEKVAGINKATGATITKVISDKDTDKPVHETEGGTPIYSVMTKHDKYHVDRHLKILDKNGQKIMDPTMYQAMEDSAAFYKEIGYPGLAETLGWPEDLVFKIARDAPKAMVAWSLALRRRVYDLEQQLAKFEADEEVNLPVKNQRA